MNKKLLSIVIAVVLAVVSLPTVGASATEISQSNISISSRSEYRIVKPGTKAYTSTSSPSSYAGYFEAGAEVKVYWVRGEWAKVRGTLENGEEGSYYIPSSQLY